MFGSVSWRWIGTSVLCLSLLSLATNTAEARRLPVPKDAQKLIAAVTTGVASVFASSQTAEAKAAYEAKTVTIRELEKLGIDTKDGALYQLFFQVDPSASDRWFFNPNVFVLVQIEGQYGDFIPASCAWSYKGQPYCVSFYAKEIQPGAAVIVHMLDDKTLSRQVWENLLKKRHPIRLDVEIIPSVINVSYSTSLQLVDDDYTINSYGHLATTEFIVPESPDSAWLVEARFLDKSNRDVGRLQFKQVWRVDPKLASLSFSRVIFWVGLAVVFGLIFIKVLYGKHTNTGEPQQIIK